MLFSFFLLLPAIFLWLQFDRPYASEGSQKTGFPGRDREPCLAARGRPLPSNQVQHSLGLAQEPVWGRAQQHHPAHGARRHRRPRGHHWVSCAVFSVLFQNIQTFQSFSWNIFFLYWQPACIDMFQLVSSPQSPVEIISEWCEVSVQVTKNVFTILKAVRYSASLTECSPWLGCVYWAKWKRKQDDLLFVDYKLVMSTFLWQVLGFKSKPHTYGSENAFWNNSLSSLLVSNIVIVTHWTALL